MVSYFLMEVLTESKLDLALVDLLAEEAGGKHEMVADLCIVNLQQVFVFIAHGEGASRTCCKDSFIAIVHCFLHR